MWLFAYGIRLHQRLSIAAGVDAEALAAREKRHVPVKRVVSVLFCCAICYGLRVVALMVLSVQAAAGIRIHVGNVSWFFLSNWIPTLIPVRLLLNEY